MKECIFVVSYLLTLAILLALIIVIIVNWKKLETSRLLKIRRNLSVIISASAFIASICLPSFSFINLFFPIAIVPLYLFLSIAYHKSMLDARELERRMEEYQKTQPIDVEYKELN